jgi:SAM-dependent methyltransferase
MTRMRRLRVAARAVAPGLYDRAHNFAMLALWYRSNLTARLRGDSADAYTDDFWAVSEAEDWDGFARALVRTCNPRSVLDAGCGSGSLLRALARVAPHVRTLGLEHSATARRRAHAFGVDVRPWDATRLGRGAATHLAESLGQWDVVLCLEVAEHLPAWHGRRLVRFLSHWDAVVFSAARPGQGGLWHLNEQPPEYWLRRFAAEGLQLQPAGDTIRDDIRGLRLGPWYAANLMLLARAAHAWPRDTPE